MKQLAIFSTISDDASAWYGDVTPDGVRNWLRENNIRPGDEVEVAINSYGGSVFAGYAIIALLRASGAKLTAHVYGVAASMAGVIACACDTLVMDDGSYLMVHNPYSLADGDSEEHRRIADVLDGLRATAIRHYLSKGLAATAEEIAALMDGGDTWISAEDAVARGMSVEVVAANVQVAACAARRVAEEAVPEAARKFLSFKKLDDPTTGTQAAAPGGSDSPPSGAAATSEAADGAPEMRARIAALERERDDALEMAAAREAELNAKLETAQAAVKVGEDALARANGEIAELKARAEAAAVVALRVADAAQEAPASWPEAVRRCGGYAEAIKQYPDLAKQYREAALGRSRVTV